MFYASCTALFNGSKHSKSTRKGPEEAEHTITTCHNVDDSLGNLLAVRTDIFSLGPQALRLLDRGFLLPLIDNILTVLPWRPVRRGTYHGQAWRQLFAHVSIWTQSTPPAWLGHADTVLSRRPTTFTNQWLSDVSWSPNLHKSWCQDPGFETGS